MWSSPEKRHRARKAHRCDSCRCRINIGEPYIKVFGVNCDGDAGRFKAHTSCWEASRIVWQLGHYDYYEGMPNVTDFEEEDVATVRRKSPEVWQAIWGGCR